MHISIISKKNRNTRHKQTNLEKNIEELTFSRHWDKNWQQLKKYVSKASPHDKMLFCQVFNSDGSSCSANIVWGQLEHVRHPCVKPDLIQYHVSCTMYDTSSISCISALYYTCNRRQPDMLESSLYNVQWWDQWMCLGQCLNLHCTMMSLSMCLGQCGPSDLCRWSALENLGSDLIGSIK